MHDPWIQIACHQRPGAALCEGPRPQEIMRFDSRQERKEDQYQIVSNKISGCRGGLKKLDQVYNKL